MFLAIGFLLLGSVNIVHSLPLIIDRYQSNAELYQRVEDEIASVRDCYNQYLELYKKFVEKIHTYYPDSVISWRLLLEMSDTITKIDNYLYYMNSRKGALLNTSPEARHYFRSATRYGTDEIQEIQLEFVNLAAQFWETHLNLSQTHLKALIEEFHMLNEQCIDSQQENSLNMYFGELDFFLATMVKDFQLNYEPPLPEICAKVEPLFGYLRNMTKRFMKLRLRLKEKGINGTIYPNFPMNELFHTIRDYDVRVNYFYTFCLNANQRSEAYLFYYIKFIPKYLRKAKTDITEHWGSLRDAVVELAQATGGRKLKNFFRRIFKGNRFLNVCAEMEDCIYPIQCHGIDLLLGNTQIIKI